MDENQSSEERVVLFKSMNKKWPKQGAKFSYDKTWKIIYLKYILIDWLIDWLIDLYCQTHL